MENKTNLLLDTLPLQLEFILMIPMSNAAVFIRVRFLSHKNIVVLKKTDCFDSGTEVV